MVIKKSNSTERKVSMLYEGCKASIRALFARQDAQLERLESQVNRLEKLERKYKKLKRELKEVKAKNENIQVPCRVLLLRVR